LLVFYFQKVKGLELPEATVDCRIVPTDGGFELELSCSVLAKNLYLTMGEEDGFFSDNYFDLLPGERVSIFLETEISEEILEDVLAMRTLSF